MGRKAKKKAGKTSPVNREDVLVGPGVRMERHGRFLHITSNRTPQQQADLNAMMAGAEPRLRAKLREEVDRIANLLRSHDTFEILSAYSLVNHLSDPDTYAETSDTSSSASVEFATLIVLKEPYSASITPVGQRVLNELSQGLRSVLDDGRSLRRTAFAKSRAESDGFSGDPPTILEDLQFLTRIFETSVRSPAYEHHHREVLAGIFQPFEPELRRIFGFSGEEAIKISAAIPDRITRRFRETAEQVRGELHSVHVDVENARRRRRSAVEDTDNAEELSQKLVEELASKSGGDVKRFLSFVAFERILLSSSEICAFVPEDLADETGLPIEVINAFLRAFSIEFGSTDPDFYEPTPTHALRRTPILNHSGRYLAPALLLLDWAIQPRLEAGLKGTKAWDGYHKHRHDFTLMTVIGRLSRMMPKGKFYTNLKYDPEGDRSREAELDGLGLYGTLALLIEVKAAELSEPAMRGAPGRLQKKLEELVTAPHEQALRARRELDGKTTTEFRLANGETIEVSGAYLDSKLLMSVSLSQIGYITAIIGANSGFFANNEYSWSISVYDLMAITDIMEIPQVFSHYAKRRIQAASLGLVEATDELDLFGHYLKDGLSFEPSQPNRDQPSTRRLLSFTDPIDAFFLHATGKRQKAAQKPKQQIPPVLEDLLNKLEVSGARFQLEAAWALLDFSLKARKTFSSSVEKARRRALKEDCVASITFTGTVGSRWVITYCCGQDSAAVERHLDACRCEKRSEFSGAKWIGVAEGLGPAGGIVGVAFDSAKPDGPGDTAGPLALADA